MPACGEDAIREILKYYAINVPGTFEVPGT